MPTGRQKILGTGCAKAFVKTSDFNVSFDFSEQYPASLESVDADIKVTRFMVGI